MTLASMFAEEARGDAQPVVRRGEQLDTYETHGSREAFERDRNRDIDFAVAGIQTVRVSERQFIREPDAIAAKVAELLARRPPRD